MILTQNFASLYRLELPFLGLIGLYSKVSSTFSLMSKKAGDWRQLKALKRRQAIEPHIGHMKNDGKLGRNFLKGIFGDKAHAILCAIGHNTRLVCNFIRSQRRSLSLG